MDWSDEIDYKSLYETKENEIPPIASPARDAALEYYDMSLVPIPIVSPKMIKNGYNKENLKQQIQNLLQRKPDLTEQEAEMEICTKECKRPLIGWRKYQLSNPSRDDVFNWFTQFPDANIGLITGKNTNLVIFDLDSKSAIEFTKQKGGFPKTPTSTTGKGEHIYVRCPNFDVGCQANKNLEIDVRGDGGYIIAPPSSHWSGRDYKWKQGLSIQDVELGVCNGWMENFLKENSKKNSHANLNKKLVTKTPTSLRGNVSWPLTPEVTEILSSDGLSEKMKSLIYNGNEHLYHSRSEADQAVTTALINMGVADEAIFTIFDNFKIGEKFKESAAPEQYLDHCIASAKELVGNNVSAIDKKTFINNGTLNIVSFQEAVVKKNHIKAKNGSLYQYNGKCFELLTEDKINKICQKELGLHRHLFSPSNMNKFVHYAIGCDFCNIDLSNTENLSYLSLQNGLYNLNTGEFVDHTPEIFTTNTLPYDFNPNADCKRFESFLNEIFHYDRDTITFTQEAIGYVLHRSLPRPAAFFFIGDGSNGKSVFLDAVASLFGKHNTSRVSLSSLSNEYYVLELNGKMLNISTETPRLKNFDTDIIKSVFAGETITARGPHQSPVQIKPFAKHFFAMNHFPRIDDSSHGMWRRIYPVEFPRKFSEHEMDINLSEKLEAELSGIFNWALVGYERLKSNNFKFSKVASHDRLKSQYESDSSSVLSFAESHLIQKNNSLQKYGDVFKSYEKFCEEERVQKESKRNFKSQLVSMGYQIEKSSSHSNQVYIFNAEMINTY